MNDRRQISGKIQYSKNKPAEKVRKTAVFSLKTAVLMAKPSNSLHARTVAFYRGLIFAVNRVCVELPGKN